VIRENPNINQWLLTLVEGSVSALNAIKSHKMRSCLTTLGIVIGVCSVIVVASIMEQLTIKINAQIKDLGTDTVTLKAYTTTEQEMLGMVNMLTYQDYQRLKDRTTGVKVMTARMRAFSLGRSVSYGGRSSQTQIIGAESDYQKAIKIFPELGRFLRSEDDERRRRVVFIGSSLAEKLKLPQNPVGEFVQIDSEWFLVIGVAESRGSLFGFDQDNFLFMPLTTAKSILGQDAGQNIDIVYVPNDGVDEIALQDSIKRELRQARSLNADEPDFFEFETAKKTRQQFSEITGAVTLVAMAIVGVSLIVGGIGIMNIMLVSVTERTKEIGIAKALGAKPRYILVQFLLEAIVLAFLGALAGLLLGALIMSAASLVIDSETGFSIPLWSIILSVCFSTAIGIIFGFTPALKASKLNPIDALRFE